MSVNGRPRKLDMDVARELGQLAAEVRALKDAVDKMSQAAEKKTDNLSREIIDLQKHALWSQARIAGIVMLGVGLGIEGLKGLL